MQIIPARLARLLDVLSCATSPILVDDLATRCGVSRRTIFREFKEAAELLAGHGLNVGTKPGQGVYLAGDPQGRDGLRAMLDARGSAEPVDSHERHLLLTLGLLMGAEVQKLQSYARVFKVSPATVSNDLDILDQKLATHGITIARKPGFGVAVRGEEGDLRAAAVATLLQVDPSRGLVGVPQTIVTQIATLMETRFAPQLLWLTDESRDGLGAYLIVMVARMTRGHLLTDTTPVAQVLAPMTDFIANSVELSFPIRVPLAERTGLGVYLSALRRSVSYGVLSAPAASSSELKSLAYQLIEHFDPELAPFLKLDDRLVDGIAQHMESALVRIRNGVWLNDPLAGEITRQYPDIVEKSSRALEVLIPIAGAIPPAEATFLATHFGAGVLRIRDHSTHRVRVAVVCGGGIGTSYFLTSQLRGRFSATADFIIRHLDQEGDWGGTDLCVASVPVEDAPVPVIRVGSVLTEDDATAIGRSISASKGTSTPSLTSRIGVPLGEQCEVASAVLADAHAILTHFTHVVVEAECDFDHLARLAGYRFGGIEEAGRRIYDDIMRRESLSTQVVPSLELVLMHTRTEGVDMPIFAFITPDGPRFSAPGMSATRSCVVMLVPPHVPRDTLDLMGRLSSALLEDLRFREAILTGDEQLARQGLEGHIRDYLNTTVTF